MAAALPLHSLCLLHASPQVVVLSIACFFFFFFFFYYYYFYFFFCRSSRRVGPTNWPIIGMLPTIISQFHRLHDYTSDTLRDVGFTFMFKGPWFFGMDFLATCDPANVHHVFNASFPNYPKGADFAEMFDVLGGGLFCADAESWRLQRKMAHGFIVNRAFRSSTLAATREKAVRGLVPLLDRVAAAGEAVDLESVFSRVTFDITCSMVFGFDSGSLSIEFPTVPFARAIDDFWEAVLFRHAVPKSWWKLLRWLRVGPEKKMEMAGEVIDQFIAQQISTKREERQKGTDLLTYYMDQASDEATGFFESEDKFLRDTVIFLMIAGRDAFAIGLSWLFWLLSQNPKVETRILEELRPHAGVFDEEVGGMVYLHGAVLEALRLFPPVPIEHKAALKADVLPSGHRVAAGTKVLFSVYAMGRMREIWGEDCLEFRPERWISDGGKIRHVPAYKFMAFNSGPRSCLGKEIGLAQLKIVAAAVVWNFQVAAVEGHVVEPKISGMIRMKNGMMVRIRKRGH